MFYKHESESGIKLQRDILTRIDQIVVDFVKSWRSHGNNIDNNYSIVPWTDPTFLKASSDVLELPA